MPRKLVFVLALMVAACEPSPPEPSDPPKPSGQEASAAETESNSRPESGQPDRLESVLDQQPPEAKARYGHRNPAETLTFFGIEPGMTVIEALPGAGWYSKILLPYLGPEGHLIGANYAQEMWPLFGFFDDEFIEGMKTWTADWPEQASGWTENGAEVSAFEFGAMPEEHVGTADVVLFIRALHNLARFEDEGGYLTAALNDAFRALKPGGIVGVVQHEARPEMPDDWANGSKGYLKKQFVIDRLTEAGFEFVAESDINANPKDQPTTDDMVWRLPPSLATSGEDPELRAELEAIGESNRMTLKFRKPE